MIFGLIGAGLLWVCLAAVWSLRFDMTEISGYELRRRAEQGDVDASDELDFIAVVPQLEALRMVAIALLQVLLAALSVWQFGLLGVVAATALVVLAPMVRQILFVARLVDDTAYRYRAKLLSIEHTLHGFLGWLTTVRVPQTDARVYSLEELKDLLRRSEGVVSVDELQHIQYALDFRHKTVADVMTPRSVIESVPIDETLGPLVLDSLYKTGHSRFPVIEGDIDHVVGVLMLRDLIDHGKEGQTIKDAMSPKVFYIHESQSLEHALHAFLQTHHHMFVVVNEYRETVGLLTLEDVVEALLGRKIVDEFDRFDDLRAVAESNPRRNNSPRQKHDV